MKVFMPLINNRFWVLIIILLLLLIYGNTQAQDWKKTLRKPALEFLGATVGEFIIGITGGSLTQAVVPLDGDIAPFIIPPAFGYIFGGSIGAPLGTKLTDKIIGDRGSVTGAYVGGIIGAGLVGFTAVKFFVGEMPSEVFIPAAVILPQLLSVVGYNLHKPDNESHSSIPKNFPQLAFTVLPEKHDDEISPKIGAKVTVRF